MINQNQNNLKSKGKKSQADKSVIGLQPKYWAEDFPQTFETISEEANDYLELEIQNMKAYKNIKGHYIDHGHSLLT